MRIEKLGTPVMFLVPSVKVYGRKYSKSRQSVAKTIHNFLNDQFGGYTCASGNIYGYFTSEFTEYDELREFRVSFELHYDKWNTLCEFLANLAADIGEECIYIRNADRAFLIYP